MPVQDAFASRLDALEAELDELVEASRTAAEVIETSPFGILVIDADGIIVSTNPTLKRILPLRGEPIGRRPIGLLHRPDGIELGTRVAAQRRLERSLASGVDLRCGQIFGIDRLLDVPFDDGLRPGVDALAFHDNRAKKTA